MPLPPCENRVNRFQTLTRLPAPIRHLESITNHIEKHFGSDYFVLHEKKIKDRTRRYTYRSAESNETILHPTDIGHERLGYAYARRRFEDLALC